MNKRLFDDDERQVVVDRTDELVKQADDGRDTKDFLISKSGQALILELKTRYKLLVRQAVAESQKYKQACFELESILQFMGVRVDMGTAAEEILDDAKKTIVDPDY